jgi:hypothetical protein
VKRCTRCDEWKPLEDFYLKWRSATNRHSMCKDCKNRHTNALRLRRTGVVDAAVDVVYELVEQCDDVLGFATPEQIVEALAEKGFLKMPTLGKAGRHASV